MNYALVFRPEVREELDEAYSWYESQQAGLGDEFLDCVDEMLNRICQMPESYAVVYRDVRRAVVRRFPYAVYYRIVSSRVIVTAIFHSRREPRIVAGANLTILLQRTDESCYQADRTSLLMLGEGDRSITTYSQTIE